MGDKPFLKQVAEHYFASGDGKERLFIFPNRRSLIFFRKYMCDLAKDLGQVMLLPRMTTVSEFYSSASGCAVADRITLLQLLYASYCRLYGEKAESFDNFVYWGDVLTADFSDLDKYKVDARSLFANVADLKKLEESPEQYADARQLKAIKDLARNLHRGGVGSDAKSSFLSLWNVLPELYADFRKSLSEQGLAYDGMVYRTLADRISEANQDPESIMDILSGAYPGIDGYVFVGLVALSTCEQLTMRRMRDAGAADFCWDCEGLFLTDFSNGAYRTIHHNISEFPQAFALEKCSNKPAVKVYNVPSSIAQSKMLPRILKEAGPEKDSLDTAVVLADETMLMPVLSSLPQSVSRLNVTMGYPLASAEWSSLMRDMIALQLHIREKDTENYFYHKNVNDILSSGVLRAIFTDEEKSIAADIVGKAEYYVPEQSFAGSALLAMIFRPVVPSSGVSLADSRQIDRLAAWLLEASSAIAVRLPGDEQLHRQFALEYYKCVNRLSEMHLSVMPKTWSHLLDQIVAGVNVPFEGEPLGGLQIMGPLETRSLDFKNLVILDANEDVFPRRSSRSSFIPPELRRAFGLPTYENQDAVWTYYFYRMVSRAEKVWMLYDSRTEGLNSGEESRFIKQLGHMFCDKCRLTSYVVCADAQSSRNDGGIAKDDGIVMKLRDLSYSASAVQDYLACPAKFYYHSVEKLYPEDEVKETVDTGMLGEVCHDALHALYSCNETYMALDFEFDKRFNDSAWKPVRISRTMLQSWLDRKQEIKAKIDAMICNKLKCRCTGVTGRDLVTSQVALEFVLGVINADIRLLESRELEEFTVLALELKCHETICGHHFIGYIDRLDTFGDGSVRVVDYKTGGDRQDVLSEEVAAKDIFSSSSDKSHQNKAALQFFIYDKFVEALSDKKVIPSGSLICNSMYSMTDLFRGDVVVYRVNPEKEASVEEMLEETFSEIEGREKPFARCNDDKVCKWCDYKFICGKVTKE